MTCLEVIKSVSDRAIYHVQVFWGLILGSLCHTMLPRISGKGRGGPTPLSTFPPAFSVSNGFTTVQLTWHLCGEASADSSNLFLLRVLIAPQKPREEEAAMGPTERFGSYITGGIEIDTNFLES